MNSTNPLIFDCRPYGLDPSLSVDIEEGEIHGVDFQQPAEQEAYDPDDGLQQDIMQQLRQYMIGQRRDFDLPLKPSGTPFQLKVWHQMQDIPCGEVLSYGTVAARLKSSARAVGGACRANPIPLFIPCHRIVAANGIGGFAGDRQGGRVEIKQWLLNHEQG